MALNVSRKKYAVSSLWPASDAVVLACLATFVVLVFRAEFHRSMVALTIETAINVAIPVAAMCWLVVRYSKNSEILTDRKWIWGLRSAAVAFAFLPFFSQIVMRRMDLGDSIEVVALVMLVNTCWFLAIFSRFGKLDRVAFVLGSALVLFVCFMTQNPAIFIAAFLYALLSLWWLLGNYWNRVKTRAIDVESNALPIRGVAVLISAAIISVFGILAGSALSSSTGVAVNGFMPSSGGTSWHDAYARSGMGDGDMLTAGQNATTSGAVDSDQFIEDSRPSMYDITTDRYESPLGIKKKQNRAVALNHVEAKHIHDVKRSEQAGKSFRTVREPKNPKTIELEERITKALIYLEGPVPVRLPMECFDHFDGWDWNATELPTDPKLTPPIQLKTRSGKPWYSIKRVQREYLPGYRVHRVKIMRLEDKIVPAPTLLKSWHIYEVKERGLFLWDKQGLVRMAGEFIAPHTMIDIVSQVPNYHILRSSENLSLVDHPSSWWESIDSWLKVGSKSGTSKGDFSPIESDPESPFIQLPDNATQKRLESLTSAWTSDVPEGWQQVEAIVNHFRGNFVVDPQAVPPTDCDDSVGWFLDNGRGPGYLFASAAAQSLRTAGYRTRLTKGFVATRDDYDRVSNQSYITAENLHVWPEVNLDGWHWLPVEPTPTYPIPYSTQTFLQWAYAGIYWVASLVFKNPITSILSFGLAAFVCYFRRRILAALGWLGWRISLTFLPGYRLGLTRKLLDLRFWAADLKRPAFEPPSKWYSQVDSNVASRFINLWRSNHFSSGFDAKSSRGEIYGACQEVVQNLSLSRIQTYAAEKFAAQRQSKDEK